MGFNLWLFNIICPFRCGSLYLYAQVLKFKTIYSNYWNYYGFAYNYCLFPFLQNEVRALIS